MFKTLGKNKSNKALKPVQIIVLGFLAVVLIGSILLTLPVSSRSGEFTSFSTASFTAVSASCVT